MLIAALVVAGLVAFPRLGVDRFPNMDLPTVYVRVSYPGAASSEVETEVAEVLEDAVSTVAGIEELRSISSDGQCFLIVTFTLSRNMDAAVQDVRDAVAGVLNRLPPGIDPPVIQKQDVDSSPILTIAVSGDRTARELYVLADRYVKNVIESAPGVGQVSIAGAADRAVQVEVDARRLAAYGISVLQVRDALARQNTEVPGGRMDEGIRERTLRTLGRIEESRQFPDLVVATVGGTSIRLSDLGQVRDATKEVRTLARLNGRPAVVLQVQRQSGENTVRVIQAVKQRLERCRALLPEDVQMEIILDQSRYILAALHEIEKHLISGSILATLTVLLFMRSWRSTLIAAVAIPTSIVATFVFMWMYGFTLNNVTMLALVLMVGVVIDDAIVVLENVFHYIEEKGYDPIRAAIEGTREIGPAVLATTLSLVIVFLPVSFMSSVTGRMLFQFGVTATTAILISMLVSFTLTPMMCSKILRPPKNDLANPAAGPKSRRGYYGWLEYGYLACLRGALRWRWLVAGVSIAVIVSNVPLYRLVKQDYIPTNVDESEFEISITGPEGATLASMSEALARIEQDLSQVEGIEFLLTSVGTRGFGGVNRGEIYVRLQDLDTRTFSWSRLVKGLLQGDPGAAWRGNFSQRQKMVEVRERLAQFSDLRCSVRNLTSLRQGAPVDIDFSITGPDMQKLAEFSERLRQKAMTIPGLVDVDTTLRLDKPELLARINRPRAAALGIEVREIADTLRVAVGGDDRVSRYRDPQWDDAYDVELRLTGIDRRDVESISQLYVRANPVALREGGTRLARPAVAGLQQLPLCRIDNVVDFQFSNAPARIDRLDRQRMVAIRANVAPGYALADRIAALRAAAEELGIPPGFEIRVLGRGRELDRTIGEFVWTLALSFVFMYIVLAAQYEHLVHPITILVSLPLAVPFGLLSLYLGKETLNLYSALGILVLFGVVKKAAILQIDHTNCLRRQGLSRKEAILRANRDRLRPILMTTISFVAGLLPLLAATGPGAEERRSIAVLAVGGQTLSLVLTLLAVPIVYTYFDDIGRLYIRLVQFLSSRRGKLSVGSCSAATVFLAALWALDSRTLQAQRPLPLGDNERIVILGGGWVEDLQIDDFWETVLTSRIDARGVTFRNQGWAGDTVQGIARAVFGSPEDGFTRLMRDLKQASPTFVLVAYGNNEAFDGPEGLPQFRQQWRRLLDELLSTGARVCAILPHPRVRPRESLPHWTTYNEHVSLYRQAMLEACQERGVRSVDLADSAAWHHTEDGIRLTPNGYWILAQDLASRLGYPEPAWELSLDAKRGTWNATNVSVQELTSRPQELRWVAVDRYLPSPYPPDPRRLAPPGQGKLRIQELPPGNYQLIVEGLPVVTASAQLWQEGVTLPLRGGWQQVEELRNLIRRKNYYYFHRYRPHNETYLFLFRKHEQGNNAVEIPQFDPIIADCEANIEQLKRPTPQHYQLLRVPD